MSFFGLFKSSKPQFSTEAQDKIETVARIAFPEGEKQVVEETDQLHALLRGRLQKAEARKLLTGAKALLVVAKDKSEARMVPWIQSTANGKLTTHECKIVYQFLTGILGDLYGGNDGSTREKAVVINATSSLAGIDAEYRWLSQKFGEENKDWFVDMRMHGDHGGRSYETFALTMSDGTSRSVHFDISSFYGRF
jgi:hypothetical protein